MEGRFLTDTAQTQPTMDDEIDDSFFRQIVEKSLDLTTVVGRGGIISYQGPAVERVLGYPPQESIGTSVFDVIHSDDLEQAYGIIERIMSGVVREAEAELRFRHANGTYRRIHAIAQLLRDKPEPLIIVTARDVTSQYLTTEMLANNNELVSRLFSISQNLIVISVPESGKILEVNDTWCQVMGYQREEVIGKTGNELGIWGSPENRTAIADTLFSQGYLEDHPAVVYTRSGELRNVVVDAQFIEVGEQTRLITSSQDVTKSRLLEEELRQAQKMESLGQLTGGVAHDFNNLLGVTMGNAELLQLALQDNPQANKYATQILEATKRGAVLTQQLLAFSRRQTLSPEEINVTALLTNMQSILQTTVTENTAVRFDYVDNHAVCVADPSQLENAILNLTLNARDAMPQGGSITYTVRQLEFAEESTPFPNLLLPAGEYVLLQVKDTGQGMDEATRLRAVEPFFTTKEVGKGTGLGLSMVFGFAEQSGGGVHLDSELGQGTTVSMLFPREPRSLPAPTVERQTSAMAAAMGDNPTVLVIEDNEPLRNLVVLYLTEAGFSVVEASGELDVAEVLNALPHLHLVVSDIVLQGLLSGPELATRIAAKHPNVKTLFMTGYSTTQAVDGSPVLQKPFTRNELMQAVQQLVAAD